MCLRNRLDETPPTLASLTIVWHRREAAAAGRFPGPGVTIQTMTQDARMSSLPPASASSFLVDRPRGLR
jgi:hypothetical protein